MARPLPYDEKTADLICEAIATSDYGLQQLCEQNPFWPSETTIYKWLTNSPEFAENYARARERQGERQAYLALQEAMNASEVGIGRLRWDARRWHAGKLNAKKYGDKTVQEHVGPNNGPIQVQEVSDKDRAAALMRLLAESKKELK